VRNVGRREPTLRPVVFGCERKRAEQQKLRGIEYRCGRAGGPVRSSVEASVMEVERREPAHRGVFVRATRAVVSWEDPGERTRSRAGETGLGEKSRMTGDCHVRICGSPGVRRFPRATRRNFTLTNE